MWPTTTAAVARWLCWPFLCPSRVRLLCRTKCLEDVLPSRPRVLSRSWRASRRRRQNTGWPARHGQRQKFRLHVDETSTPHETVQLEWRTQVFDSLHTRQVSPGPSAQGVIYRLRQDFSVSDVSLVLVLSLCLLSISPAPDLLRLPSPPLFPYVGFVVRACRSCRAYDLPRVREPLSDWALK